MREDGNKHDVVSRDTPESPPVTLLEAECFKSSVACVTPLVYKIDKTSRSRSCKLLASATVDTQSDPSPFSMSKRQRVCQ